MKHKLNNKIISITNEHVTILLNTGNTITMSIQELNFQPKLNEMVEVYKNSDEIIVLQSKEKRINWFLLLLCTLIPIVLACSIILFTHKKQDTENVNAATTEQVLTTTTMTIGTTTTTTTTTTSSTYTTSSQSSIIDTTAEELRDMENDGTLKTGQLYRFTTKLIRQEYWEAYSGHFKALNTYHTIWVEASNAPITGVQVQIKKSMIEGWQEGATVTFTVKIMEDSEKFQFWVATDATLITIPTKEKHTESTTQEIDTQAILHGDYSSIAGTWRNEKGEWISFDKNGLTNGTKMEGIYLSNENTLHLSLRGEVAGASMGIYPPGTSIPMKRFENNQMVSIEDPTDKSKTRIIIVQQSPSDGKGVFYKID